MDDAKPNSARNDDDDWLDALAGRPRLGADAAVNAEATLLRDAVRRWPASAPAASAEQIEAEIAALLAAAHADSRLRSRRGCMLCTALRTWLARPWTAGALAAAVACVLALVLVLPHQALQPPQPGADAGDVLRGGPAAVGVQTLRATDPRALRDRIADELAAAGASVARYERMGRYGLDAEWPGQPPDAVLHLLRVHGLPPPTGAALAVEIEPER